MPQIQHLFGASTVLYATAVPISVAKERLAHGLRDNVRREGARVYFCKKCQSGNRCPILP